MNTFFLFFAPLLVLGALPTLGVVVIALVHLTHHLVPNFKKTAALFGDLWIGLGFAALFGDHYSVLLRLAVAVMAVVAGLALKRYTED